MKKLVLFAGVAMLSACGGGNDLSEADSQVAFSSAMTAMTSAWGSAQSANPMIKKQALSSTTINYSGNCALGGTVALTGTFSDDTDTSTADLDAAFAKCATQGAQAITIDGDLAWDITVTQTNMSYKWKGSLDFSGDVSGSCEMDVTATLTYGAGSYTYTYDGKICGHDAKATMSGSAG